MSTKVAMIGAGSVVFCKLLMADIMATPALEGSEFALMSRTWPKLKNMEDFARRMLEDNGLSGKVWATLDRREGALLDRPQHLALLRPGSVLEDVLGEEDRVLHRLRDRGVTALRHTSPSFAPATLRGSRRASRAWRPTSRP